MNLMNATTYQHPTTGPISLRIDDRFPGRIEVEVTDSGRAEITVSTDDTTGPAFDAVRDTRITADGGVINIGNGSVVIGSIGGTVIVNGQIISGGGASGPVLVRVRMAQGSSLSVATGSTSLELTGTSLARIGFETGSGDLIGACCDVLDARAGSGDIRVRAMGSGTLRTGSGDITIDMAGTVTARTGSGDIRLSRCAGPAALSTGSGDVSAPDAADVRTGSGRVRRIGGNR